MLTKERVLEIFRETGVLLEGHFLLTSGCHSAQYLQCAQIFQYPWYSEELCKELTNKFKNDNIDLVIGPAIGAIQMSYEVSRCLGVKNIFAEREDGVMTLRRNFAIEKRQKVLVVEDVVTTGGSVQEVIKLVHDLDGEVVGVGVIVDRSNGKANFGTRLESIVSIDVESFEAHECPMCKQGVPFIKPGSRNKNNIK